MSRRQSVTEKSASSRDGGLLRRSYHCSDSYQNDERNQNRVEPTTAARRRPCSNPWLIYGPGVFTRPGSRRWLGHIVLLSRPGCGHRATVVDALEFLVVLPSVDHRTRLRSHDLVAVSDVVWPADHPPQYRILPFSLQAAHIPLRFRDSLAGVTGGLHFPDVIDLGS